MLLLGTRGWAPRYEKGLMGAVADRRGMARAGCMVSSPIHSLGTKLWVLGLNTRALLLCTVVDTSAPRDRERHIRTGRLVELDYAVALALCGHLSEPVVKCPVIVLEE